MTLKYKVETASIEQIYAHLKNCDADFSPPLSRRVDLLEYSTKIFEKSISFEAWQDNAVVGMINAYFNDVNSTTCFVTNVSVLRECRRNGVASILLEMCLEHARDLGFSKIKLEVSRENSPAIRLYSRAGFKVVEKSRNSLLMEREIIGATC